MNQVGNHIKKLRQSKGITQEELAEHLNVTRQAVSNWETNKTQPDIETLTKLAEYFEVSVEEIIYGEKQSKAEIITKTVTQKGGKEGIGFGAVLAMIISYTHWHSIGWAIFHGMLNWIYVIYYIIRY